jgi:hypothetical protein
MLTIKLSHNRQKADKLHNQGDVAKNAPKKGAGSGGWVEHSAQKEHSWRLDSIHCNHIPNVRPPIEDSESWLWAVVFFWHLDWFTASGLCDDTLHQKGKAPSRTK